MSQSIRIAMWSGPRNLSTALMRSWGNRADTFVCDEPFYAHYLAVTKAPHPGAEEIIAHHESDWRKVVEFLTGPVPEGKTVFYQKHMAHHLLPDMERGWLGEVINCFLIRDPLEVLASLHKVTPFPKIADTGFPQQWEIFQLQRERTGKVPPVIDAKDVLHDPRSVLTQLCDRISLPFTDAMLSWPRGPRETDGIWAKYWYDSVVETSGFMPYPNRERSLPGELRGLHRECLPFYEQLYSRRITP
jgi:hypothetical protein